MTRDYTISITRTLGMIFIVLCHFFGYGPIKSLSFLSEVFNVGTSLFLFISGFLYEKKEIKNNLKWLFSRYKRICFPMYIWMVFVFIYRFFFVTHAAEPLKYLIFFFNLQGLTFIFNRINYNIFSVVDADQLWFLTVIMLCYFLVPLLSKIKHWFIKLSSILKCLILVLLVGLQIALTFLGFNFNYFLLFTIGYFTSLIWDRKFKNNRYIIYTIICGLSLSFRLLFGFLCLNEKIYSSIIVPLSQDIFAIWIYFTVCMISQKAPKAFNIIAKSKFAIYADELSFYIYMTHFIFIAGNLSTLSLTHSTVLNVLIAVILTMISSILLKLLCKIIIPKKSTV